MSFQFWVVTERQFTIQLLPDWLSVQLRKSFLRNTITITKKVLPNKSLLGLWINQKSKIHIVWNSCCSKPTRQNLQAFSDTQTYKQIVLLQWTMLIKIFMFRHQYTVLSSFDTTDMFLKKHFFLYFYTSHKNLVTITLFSETMKL